MKKYLQNRIAESGATLPVVALYTTAVWLLAGLLSNGWWLQIAVYGLSVYLLVELSNGNALLRVRSRMVSCSFLMLSALTVTSFGSLASQFIGLCLIAAMNILFRSYQDETSVEKSFYCFLFMGIASLFCVRTLYILPLLWLLMAVYIQSLSWRTWKASVLGVLTPYWLVMPWFVYQQKLPQLKEHFAGLADWTFPVDYSSVGSIKLLDYGFIIVLLLVGYIHFCQHNIDEKIRTRQFYGFFMSLAVFSAVLLALQPQAEEPFVRLLIICVSPFVAHFFTFTGSRTSNILFVVTVTCCILLAVVNVNPPLLATFRELLADLWNGLLNF